MGQAHRDIEIGTMNHDSNLLKILPGHPQKAIPLYSSSGKRIISDPDMCLSPPLPAAVGHQHHQNKSLVGHRPSTESIHNTPLRQIFHSLIILQFVSYQSRIFTYSIASFCSLRCSPRVWYLQ